MEALRYVRKIESEKIVISNLGQFLGKEVEIIILPISARMYDTVGKPLKQKHRTGISPFEPVSLRGEGPTAAEMVVQDRI